MGGDLRINSVYACTTQFQSTPPHGGRPTNTRNRSAWVLFQSTPPHGGRRLGLPPGEGSILVSIHAPAWGATQDVINCFRYMMFQSTPPHGGRHQRGSIQKVLVRFNPRPRMGGDLFGLRFHLNLSSFNPRPRMGGDKENLCDFYIPMFQSTPPHGGRLLSDYSFLCLCVSIHAPAWGATN